MGRALISDRRRASWCKAGPSWPALLPALIAVCSFLQNASKNRLVTRDLTQQKTIYILFQAYPRMLGELSILLTRCANSDARYRTQPASKEHTVFHMYGTYILPYANMCCNCCCCQHPPTGCIICGVRNNLTSDPAKHKGIYLLRRYTQFFTCMAPVSSCTPTCATTAAAANIHQPDASYAVSEVTSHLIRQSTLLIV